MKRATLRYGVTQFSHWTASTGANAFATAYLLKRGFSGGAIGALLVCAGLLSCLTQPLLASAVDRAKRFVLVKIMLALALINAACHASQLIFALDGIVAGVVYMIGVWSNDLMSPFLNALYVAYNDADYRIHFGVTRGAGFAASALSSLVVGVILAKWGAAWMLLFLVIWRGVNLLALAGYSAIERKEALNAQPKQSVSVLRFAARYKWYCLSLLGILFLGMYHAMTENYMIAIMENLSGDSGNVGTALFLSMISAVPVIFCFDRIRRRMRDTWILKIAALSFLLKSVLFCLARSIAAIYIFQLLHITSYAFLAPVQLYYAKAKVRACDMVKGQAFMTAAYALGCSAGNFVGGQMLELGVREMLLAGVIMSAVGTLLLFFTVNRSDAALDC